MAGYAYRGTDFDVFEPLKPLAPRRYAGAVCGTRPGYMRHRANDEDPCADCTEANASYNRDYRERVKARLIKKGWTAAKCGTVPGYRGQGIMRTTATPCPCVSRAGKLTPTTAGHAATQRGPPDGLVQSGRQAALCSQAHEYPAQVPSGRPRPLDAGGLLERGPAHRRGDPGLHG